MVEACEEMVGIGGGAIARDELEEARKKMGKAVKFVPADMNHSMAIEKATNSGFAPPADFRSETYTIFQPN